MEIKNYLTNTLNDWSGKIPVEIFLGGCNFRCGFCHNPSLINNYENTPTIVEEEILKYLKRDKRKGWKDGLVISGGEPTIHQDLPNFIRKVKDIGLAVKLDTNGTNPEMLEELINQKLLDYIAMDMKTVPIEEKYEKLVGREVNIQDIVKSTQLIRNSDVDYMFRTTVIRRFHDYFIIGQIGEFLKKSKRYQIQNFHPENGTLDEEFQKIKPFCKEDLDRLKDIAELYFEEVIVKE